MARVWKGHELDKYDEQAEYLFSDVSWDNLKQVYHDVNSKFETTEEYFKGLLRSLQWDKENLPTLPTDELTPDRDFDNDDINW